MFALKVQVNDDTPIIAGADDLGVLNATVNCIGKLGESTRRVHDNGGADLFLTVGGLTSRLPDLPDEHLRWMSQRPLRVGDVIHVEIMDTTHADAPIAGEAAEKMQHDEREYFEHCKKIYLELRAKYEPS